MIPVACPSGEPHPNEQEKLLLVNAGPGMHHQFAQSCPNYGVLTAADETSALEHINEHGPKVAFLDLGPLHDLSDPASAFRMLSQILQAAPRTKVIVTANRENRDALVRAIDLGAWDSFQKPIDNDSLCLIIKRALHVARLEAENWRLKSMNGQALPGVITADPTMLALCQKLEQLAPTSLHVLIRGERGTGKGLLARALHQRSARSKHPFVWMNCAGIPARLLERELFGCAQGARAGATQRTIGKIETAHRGTLFLDEVGNMPPKLQAKLCDVLEKRRLIRRGGQTDVEVDIRIVSATHLPAKDDENETPLQQGLFDHLAGHTIEIPPLRARGGDPLLLGQHFIDVFARDLGRPAKQLADDAKRVLMTHHWPGNVQELVTTIQRAVILTDGTTIQANDLSLDSKPCSVIDRLGRSRRQHPTQLISLRDARDRAERQAVDAAVKKSRGNLSTAAKLLGISRPTLYALLRRHEDLQRPGSPDA